MAESLLDVPENEVLKIVEGFMSDGFIKITIEKQSDGNWTVTGEP